MGKTRKLRKGSTIKKVISTLEAQGKRVFTVNEIAKILGVKESYAKVLVHRLQKAHWLNRTKKGVYQVIPSSYGDSLDVPIPSDPYYIASKGAKIYYISHLSAAFLHGLTDQIPATVFISTPTKYHKKIEKQYNFKFVYIPSKMLDFGCKEINYRGVKLIISDIERTIVDAVNKPKYTGGLPIVYEVIQRAKDEVNLRNLLIYALKIKKKTLLQRLGYLTELAGYRWNSQEIASIRKIIMKTKAYLDPSTRRQRVAEYSAKWNLVINVPLSYLQGEEGVR